MGNYYNPPLDVLKIGRRLKGSTYDELIKELDKNEVLVGLFDRIAFYNAPHLFSEAEFREFTDQPIGRLGFFAMNKHSLGFDHPIEE
jgi:hypothetical protein